MDGGSAPVWSPLWAGGWRGHSPGIAGVRAGKGQEELSPYAMRPCSGEGSWSCSTALSSCCASVSPSHPTVGQHLHAVQRDVQCYSYPHQHSPHPQGHHLWVMLGLGNPTVSLSIGLGPARRPGHTPIELHWWGLSHLGGCVWPKSIPALTQGRGRRAKSRTWTACLLFAVKLQANPEQSSWQGLCEPTGSMRHRALAQGQGWAR